MRKFYDTLGAALALAVAVFFAIRAFTFNVLPVLILPIRTVHDPKYPCYDRSPEAPEPTE